MSALRAINENTSLPFKVVVPIVVAAVSCTLWLTSELEDIKSIQRDSWTKDNQRVWTAQLRESNPDVTVPEIDLRWEIPVQKPEKKGSPHQQR